MKCVKYTTYIKTPYGEEFDLMLAWLNTHAGVGKFQCLVINYGTFNGYTLTQFSENDEDCILMFKMCFGGKTQEEVRQEFYERKRRQRSELNK